MPHYGLKVSAAAGIPTDVISEAYSIAATLVEMRKEDGEFQSKVQAPTETQLEIQAAFSGVANVADELVHFGASEAGEEEKTAWEQGLRAKVMQLKEKIRGSYE